MEHNSVEQVPLCVNDKQEQRKDAKSFKDYSAVPVHLSEGITEGSFCHRAENSVKNITMNGGNHTDQSLKPRSAYRIDRFIPVQNSLSALNTGPTNEIDKKCSSLTDVKKKTSPTTDIENRTSLTNLIDDKCGLTANFILPVQNSLSAVHNFTNKEDSKNSPSAVVEHTTNSPVTEVNKTCSPNCLDNKSDIATAVDILNGNSVSSLNNNTANTVENNRSQTSAVAHTAIPSTEVDNLTRNVGYKSDLATNEAIPVQSPLTDLNSFPKNVGQTISVDSISSPINDLENKTCPISYVDVSTCFQTNVDNKNVQNVISTDLKNDSKQSQLINAATELADFVEETNSFNDTCDSISNASEEEIENLPALDVIFEENEDIIEVEVHNEDNKLLDATQEEPEVTDEDLTVEEDTDISDQCEHIEASVFVNGNDVLTNIEPANGNEVLNSDIERIEITPDIKINNIICEDEENTYQEDTATMNLLHESECSNKIYCETSFGKSDIDCEICAWKSKHRLSKSEGRKVSLEQRLKRRFTIHDEHKHEVAKRIIALVVKYSLFVFNFCSWVIACVVIGLGLWLLTDKGKIVTDGTDFFLDPSIMVCTVGGITFVVAFLGCVGALRENLLILKVFFVVLGIIVVLEIIIAITIFVMYTVPSVKEKFLRSTPENILRSAIQRYMDDKKLKSWIDLIQQEFRCCGIGGGEADEGFRDWQINAYFNCTPSNKSIYRCAVPTSCCIFEKGDRVNIMCGFELSDKPLVEVRDYIFTRGCIHGFGEWLSKHDELIVIAALSTLIMQFLAVICAKIMIRRIVKHRRRWSSLLRSSPSLSS